MRFKKLISLIFLLFSLPVFGQDSSLKNLDVVEIYKILPGDSLYEIAERFDVGIEELIQANPYITDPDEIYDNDVLDLPLKHLPPDAPKKGIVINLAELRLYFFPEKGEMKTFPISIGKDLYPTPLGKTKIFTKRKNPTWTPPASAIANKSDLPKEILPGEDNPLGDYAMDLGSPLRNNKWQSILIHGTNRSWSIGMKASYGCIRLYPKDIKILFENSKIGMLVNIVNQPVKIAKLQDKIYLELHLPKLDDDQPDHLSLVKKTICDKIKNCQKEIDWKRVEFAIKDNSGIPFDVTFIDEN